ncbi:MAG: tetratricopeptide repeat protein [Bacteroidales bacterium]|nr:tetratricopeptide repeat protein [Bacteroidales bacterium]
MKKFLLTIAFVLATAMSSLAQYDKDVFNMRGRMALQDGKYTQAIEHFNILARLDSTDYWCFFFRGIAKYNLGDIRGAQADFNTSVRLNPVFTNGYHYRAITESRTGNYDKAFADFDKAISLRPGFNGLYYSRGVTNFLARRFPEAVDDFNRYIRKDAKDPSAYLNRGAAYLFLGDTLKAMNDYNKAIKLDRFEPECYIRRGRVYAAQEKFPAAVADMTKAIELDSTNTLAYFNRALLYYELHDYNSAMRDLNRVLKDEPGNALTLYNRSLLYAQVGELGNALEDMDRVININPRNVLAYYNRAAFFMEMGRWRDALSDYNKAIELYPDFAKAYLNRSYVENMLGMNKESKADYKTAQRKVGEYRAKNASGEASFADTTKKYDALLALDADFAKKDFDNELIQHRDIDIRLRPLYKFHLTAKREDRNLALSNRYENPLIDHFIDSVPVPVVVSNSDSLSTLKLVRSLSSVLSGDGSKGAGSVNLSPSETYFLMGIYDVQQKNYTSALNYFDKAVAAAENSAERDRYSKYYKAFYLMNRGVLRAEMIEFIASLEGNVQTLSMDDQGATRARVSDRVARRYDYSEAIEDMQAATEIIPDIPYLYFNLGNLYCLDGEMVNAIDGYTRAINLYPVMGDAYFNRGLVLIYVKDKEKGCIDLSRAGELGVKDAYSVIDKYCTSDEQR